MNWVDSLRKRYMVTADPLRTQRRIELAALVLLVLLCLQLIYAGVRMAMLGPPDVVHPAADSMKVPVVRSLDEVTSGERLEIVNRPLFWSSRRPVEVVSVPDDDVPGKNKAGALRDVKQVGVFGSGNEAGIIALVNGKKRRILLGETLKGWTLESIRDTESEFVANGRREVLTLQRGKVTASRQVTAKSAPVVITNKTPDGQQPASSSTDAASGGTEQKQEEPGLGLGQRSRQLNE